jgi:hypothetical protein
MYRFFSQDKCTKEAYTIATLSVFFFVHFERAEFRLIMVGVRLQLPTLTSIGNARVDTKIHQRYSSVIVDIVDLSWRALSRFTLWLTFCTYTPNE